MSWVLWLPQLATWREYPRSNIGRQNPDEAWWSPWVEFAGQGTEKKSLPENCTGFPWLFSWRLIHTDAKRNYWRLGERTRKVCVTTSQGGITHNTRDIRESNYMDVDKIMRHNENYIKGYLGLTKLKTKSQNNQLFPII